MDILTPHIHDDIPWCMLFADDVVLINESREEVNAKLELWRETLESKGKFYRTAVRPAILYGSECWTIKKQQEHKVKVAEMWMLRWSSGFTLKDKVRNETIRNYFRIVPIDEKIREGRLRWFGHVRRRPINTSIRKCEDIDIGMERRGRGTPRLMRERVIRKDLELLDISEDLVEERGEWRRSIDVVDDL
ncbi:uncharacterized protein [Rutidosis leptorrhynchoides]|uniref:uncharacterized protein n=1 Tax=Rutidosis leptorrhynchoides TaxID=125765 RepID=UPI003A98D044